MASAPPLRASHASGLHAAEQELAALHEEMLQQGREDEARTVRLSVLNLVAVCIDEDAARLAESTVDDISRAHPARAIIVLSAADADAPVEADLSLRCSPALSGQVCTEQVFLTLSSGASKHLSSVVSPLLVSDVPVYVWLVGSPPLPDSLGDETLAISRDVIVDSDAYPLPATALRLLAEEQRRRGDRLCLADLAWAKTRRWRELTAQAFDGADIRAFAHHVERVEVECAGTSVSSAAWLLAGWLHDRLTSTVSSSRPMEVRARPRPRIPDGDISLVRLWCSEGGHQATVTLERQEQSLRTTIDVDGGVTAARAVPVARPDSVRLVGAVLEEAEEDAVYLGALDAAASLATRQAGPLEAAAVRP